MKTLTQIALRRYTRSTPPRDGVRQGRGASMRDVNSSDGARLGEGVLARSIVLEHSSHQRIWRPRLVQQRRSSRAQAHQGVDVTHHQSLLVLEGRQ